MVERRLLQGVLILGALVPLLAGGAGMLVGPAFLRGVASPVPTDLDSHVRYLSGLLLAAGLIFASCARRVEAKAQRLRLAASIVFTGGLGRAVSLAMVGAPGIEHRLALGLELIAVPLIVLWQARIARRCGQGD